MKTGEGKTEIKTVKGKMKTWNGKQIQGKGNRDREREMMKRNGK